MVAGRIAARFRLHVEVGHLEQLALRPPLAVYSLRWVVEARAAGAEIAG